MAENQGGAQNKLGQLYVEFGSKGLPGLLKNMNSISASFLLGKNAANQFLQTLTTVPKEGAKNATEIGKMSNALATSSKEYQKLSMYLKSKNVSEGLLNDFSKLQQVFYDIATGMGDVPEGISTAFSNPNVALDIDKYKGSFEDILQLIEDLKEATNGLDKDQRNQILRQIGLSPEWGYLWDRGDFNLRDSAAISDEALEKNIKAGEAMAETKVAVDNLKYELVSKIAPALTDISKGLTDKTLNAKEGKYNGFFRGIPMLFSGGWENFNKKEASMPKTDSSYQNFAETSQFNTQLKPEDFASPLPTLISPPDLSDDSISENPPPLPFLSMDGSGFIPPNVSTSNLTNYIEINNNNSITGENGAEIVDQIAAMNSEDIQYTQFQVQNRAMV